MHIILRINEIKKWEYMRLSWENIWEEEGWGMKAIDIKRKEKNKKPIKETGMRDERGRGKLWRAVSWKPRRCVQQCGLRQECKPWDGRCCICSVLGRFPGLSFVPDREQVPSNYLVNGWCRMKIVEECGKLTKYYEFLSVRLIQM